MVLRPACHCGLDPQADLILLVIAGLTRNPRNQHAGHNPPVFVHKPLDDPPVRPVIADLIRNPASGLDPQPTIP